MKEMSEEEERKFWEEDNYGVYTEELRFYRELTGDLYRLTHPIKKIELSIDEFLRPNEVIKPIRKRKRKV